MEPVDTRAETDWPELTRQRRAIVVVDVVESVRLMQANEADVIDRWRHFVNEVRTQVLPVHGGRLVKSLGDGLLLEFKAVHAAVSAAFDVQRRVVAYSAGRHADAVMSLRIGVHAADVVVDDLDVYGTGVNLAARLATLAAPGEIVASSEVRQGLIDMLDADVNDMGECWLKNLSEPVRAWNIRPVAAGAPTRIATPASLGANKATLAVMPFISRSAVGVSDMLGELVSEDMIAWLTRVPYLSVISPLSSMALRERPLESSSTAALLGATYLIQGSCAREGDAVRVHAQLLDGATGTVLWAGSQSGALTGLLRGDEAVVRNLAHDVCHALVGTEVTRAASSPLPTLKSYTILFGAIALLHRLSLREFDRAREMLEYLIERHPRLAEPRAWLGKWHVMRIGQGWSPDRTEDGQRAIRQTAAALDAEPNHALSLTIDGFIAGYIKKDLATAERRYESALEANPNESLALLFRSAMHGYREEGRQAIDCALSAQRLSPIDPMRYYFDHFTSLAMLLAGDYAGAIEFGQRSLKSNRVHASSLRALAMAQALNGQESAARATAAELLRVEPALTCSAFRARYPGQNQAQVDRLVAALAAAGIPP